jgi:sarcosine oxidase subunit gamma
MPEPYQWQSALASQAIEARALAAASEAGVVLCERPPGTQLVVRGNASAGDFKARVARVLGVEVPVTANTAHRNAGNALLWLGPDEWLVVAAAQAGADLAMRLDEALDTLHHAVVDVSHSRTVIGLSGARARDVLMKGTNVDLHARRFAPDNCIQARLGRCHMLLHQLDDIPSYDVYVHRSFAVYAWSWLSDAAAEYGLAVRGEKPE